MKSNHKGRARAPAGSQLRVANGEAGASASRELLVKGSRNAAPTAGHGASVVPGQLIVLKSRKSRVRRSPSPPLAALRKTSFYSAELQIGASRKIPGTRQNTKKSGSPAQGRSASCLGAGRTALSSAAQPQSRLPIFCLAVPLVVVEEMVLVSVYLCVLLTAKEISYWGVFDQLFILVTSFPLHNEFKLIPFL